MTMTPLEMASTYNQADDKKKRIEILMQLNGMSKDQVIEIPKENNCEVDGRMMNKGGIRNTKLKDPVPDPVPTSSGIFLDAKEVDFLKDVLKDVEIQSDDMVAILKFILGARS